MEAVRVVNKRDPRAATADGGRAREVPVDPRGGGRGGGSARHFFPWGLAVSDVATGGVAGSVASPALSLSMLVLGHSRLIWARFGVHQNLQTILRCHIAALEAIGGVPREILYISKPAVIGQAAFSPHELPPSCMTRKTKG
jgi:hypothetical protein